MANQEPSAGAIPDSQRLVEDARMTRRAYAYGVGRLLDPQLMAEYLREAKDR